MQHTIVRRRALLLAALFVLWAAVFAWVVGRDSTRVAAPPASTSPAAVRSDGETLFTQHCSSCHARDDLIVAPERRSELEILLEAHGDASTLEDRAILDYLAALPLR